jgi:hypothetical protein
MIAPELLTSRFLPIRTGSVATLAEWNNRPLAFLLKETCLKGDRGP